jgi:hypothetical protein
MGLITLRLNRRIHERFERDGAATVLGMNATLYHQHSITARRRLFDTLGRGQSGLPRARIAADPTANLTLIRLTPLSAGITSSPQQAHATLPSRQKPLTQLPTLSPSPVAPTPVTAFLAGRSPPATDVCGKTAVGSVAVVLESHGARASQVKSPASRSQRTRTRPRPARSQAHLT